MVNGNWIGPKDEDSTEPLQLLSRQCTTRPYALDEREVTELRYNLKKRSQYWQNSRHHYLGSSCYFTIPNLPRPSIALAMNRIYALWFSHLFAWLTSRWPQPHHLALFLCLATNRWLKPRHLAPSPRLPPCLPPPPMTIYFPPPP